MEPSLPVRIGSNLWPGYETLYLARDLGFYNNTTIKLIDYPSATEEVRAYRYGEIEGAGLSADLVLSLAATHNNIRIVAIMNISDGGDVILGKPGIKEMKDLMGKRVGVESTSLGAFVIARALELNDMSTQDIEIVSLELSEHEMAYKNDQVDAIVTFYPVKSALLSMGANILFDSTQIPGEIVDVLVVSQDAIANSPQTVQKLVDGHFFALNYLNTNPQEAATIMAKRSQVSPEEFLNSLDGLKQPNLNDNLELLNKSNPSLIKAMEKLEKIMLKNNLLPNTVEITDIFDDSFVKNVKL